MDNQNNGVFGEGVQQGVVPEVKDGGVTGMPVNEGGNVVPNTVIPEVNAQNNSMQVGANVGSFQGNEVGVSNMGMPGNETSVTGNSINSVTAVNSELSFDLPSVNNQPSSEIAGNNMSIAGNENVMSSGSMPRANSGVDMNAGISNNSVNSGIGTDSGMNNNIQTNQNITSNSNNGGNNNDNVVPIVSVKRYFGYMILFMIPVLGFIMLIVKALDKKDKNISNYAKAQLLMGIISVILMVLMFFGIAVLIREMTSDVVNNVISTTSEEVQDNSNFNIDDYSSIIDEYTDTEYAIG